MASTRDEIRSAAEQVLDSVGSFAILASSERPAWYVQWVNQGAGISVEIADPEANGETPLDGEQLDAVTDLGFEKRDPNFGRDFAPGEHDPESLTEVVLECFERVYGITDPAALELAVDG